MCWDFHLQMRLLVPVYWTGTCAKTLRKKERLRGVAIEQHRRVSVRPGGAAGRAGSQRWEDSARSGSGPRLFPVSLPRPCRGRSRPGRAADGAELRRGRKRGGGRDRAGSAAGLPLSASGTAPPVPGNRSRRCWLPLSSPPAVAPAMSGRASLLSPPPAEGSPPPSPSEGLPPSLASRCGSPGREEEEEQRAAVSRSPPGHR